MAMGQEKKNQLCLLSNEIPVPYDLDNPFSIDPELVGKSE